MNKIFKESFAALALFASVCVWADDFEDASQAYQRKDYATAMSKFKAAAAQGNQFAQWELGEMNRKGDGVTQNYAEAIKWYKLSAEGGFIFPQRRLGYMHATGQGVAQDYIEANKWFQMGAAEGDPVAQNNLGLSYLKGLGKAKDYVMAHMWFNLSSIKAEIHREAAVNRERVEAMMSPSQIADAQKLARECQARNFKNCE